MSEFVEGTTRERSADFSDKPGLVRAVWSALYDDDECPQEFTHADLLAELSDLPVLIIVDDLDTVLDDEELSEFLLYDLRSTKSRVIYTSRHLVQGMRNIEVGPFTDTELEEFVRLRSVEYGADRTQCLKRLTAIRSVTNGYPLFVDDLIRHAAIVGVDAAMRDWHQRRGDAAREYVLRRQIEHLGRSCGDLLIALSAATRALTPEELASIAGLTNQDVEGSIRELLRWRMVNRITENPMPVYNMNPNTTRLVRQTYVDDSRFRTYTTAFRALVGERVPQAKKRAIGSIIYQTKELLRTESFDAARVYLEQSIAGELSDSADLYSVLGWLYSKQDDLQCRESAEDAFTRAYELGSSKVDTYFHWVIMAKNHAGLVMHDAKYSGRDEQDVAERIGDLWKECERVCKIGMDRCGSSQLLCYWAGYAACRQARAQEMAGKYNYAQGIYTRSIDWYRDALEGRAEDIWPINKGSIWRGLAFAFDGLGDEDQLRDTLLGWYAICGPADGYFEAECRRLARKYRSLHGVPEFRSVLKFPPDQSN